ncbi:MAG: WbuC family cupin fold metalloprotein [Victivallaceae bacterium]|nr:WbuC family cupin fold metalloprotein [Victivallaceae bacterium]
MRIIDRDFMDGLSARARAGERKRAHSNLHQSLEEDIHRLCMGAEPGTFVRPHRHFAAGKWELLIILRGKIAVLLFDKDGRVLERIELTAGGDVCAVEIPAATWHAFTALESGSAVMEIKRGPYTPPAAGDWLAGTPAEGEAGASELENWYHHARSGDKLPSPS